MPRTKKKNKKKRHFEIIAVPLSDMSLYAVQLPNGRLVSLIEADVALFRTIVLLSLGTISNAWRLDRLTRELVTSISDRDLEVIEQTRGSLAARWFVVNTLVNEHLLEVIKCKEVKRAS